MAEKTSELKENSGILSEGDRDAISTVAGAESGDAFVEKYTDEVDYSFGDNREARALETNTGDAPGETEHIKAQIEETRKGMGETIDAIQEKLSISNISEQVKEQVSEQITSAVETVKDSVYEATIGKARYFMKQAGKSEIVNTARTNPFPFALIGLGVGLLLLGRNRSSARNAREYFAQRSSNRQQPSLLRSAGETVTGAANSAYESVGSVASSTYDTVGNVAGSAVSGISNTAGSAYKGVSNAASKAYSSVNEAAHVTYEKIGEYGTQARESYDYYIEENPLAVGAVALAIGAAVGAAIPSTRYEGELLGDYRQQVFDKAQTAAGDLVERVKEVASEAQKTIGDEVKSAVNETTNTIGNETRTQGLPR